MNESLHGLVGYAMIATMNSEDKVRRAGYTPDNVTLGRRGRHTRETIVDRAGQLFVAQGYHGTSIDAIAKAVGGSRATVYQYFQSKDEIFLELLGQCEPAVLAHGRRLGGLGADADGLANLHQWLVELANLYDRHSIVFLEFPGIGLKQGLPPTRAGAVSDEYARMVATTLRAAGVDGIDPGDAAGALLRISHMVHLHRFRGMLGLDLIEPSAIASSLAIAMQLLLFPDTPHDVISDFASRRVPSGLEQAPLSQPSLELGDTPDPAAVSPTRQDMLSAASSLFAEHGYYAVAMEDIAAAAKVSRATLYRHFNTKVKILVELSAWSAVEGAIVADELHQLAAAGANAQELHSWISRYVRFHRTYGGVIRAWYDGTVSQQLPKDTVTQGLGLFQSAVADFLDGIDLPAGIQPRVAASIFLAVLGRLTEREVSEHPTDSDYDTAGLMMRILGRSLLSAMGR